MKSFVSRSVLLTGNFQRSRALVARDLDGDVGGVVDLAILDDQLPLLTLRHNLDPTCGWCQDEPKQIFHTYR